jgi:hypothetical protein
MIELEKEHLNMRESILNMGEYVFNIVIMEKLLSFKMMIFLLNYSISNINL